MSGRNIGPLARTATKDRIYRLLPLCSFNAGEFLYEEFCRVKLALYHSLREIKSSRRAVTHRALLIPKAVCNVYAVYDGSEEV
jgi:hypothetical protein